MVALTKLHLQSESLQDREIAKRLLQAAQQGGAQEAGLLLEGLG